MAPCFTALLCGPQMRPPKRLPGSPFSSQVLAVRVPAAQWYLNKRPGVAPGKMQRARSVPTRRQRGARGRPRACTPSSSGTSVSIVFSAQPEGPTVCRLIFPFKFQSTLNNVHVWSALLTSQCTDAHSNSRQGIAMLRSDEQTEPVPLSESVGRTCPRFFFFGHRSLCLDAEIITLRNQRLSSVHRNLARTN